MEKQGLKSTKIRHCVTEPVIGGVMSAVVKSPRNTQTSDSHTILFEISSFISYEIGSVFQF